MFTEDITISVVSHNQSHLVNNLLESINNINFKGKIICTINIGNEKFNFFENLDIKYICNDKPLGFGLNHNNAFKQCRTTYFVVINPDILILDNIFEKLVIQLNTNKNIGVITCASFDKNQIKQDNARHFPNINKIIKKLLGHNDFIDYKLNSGLIYADWISGQFMLFNSEIFSKMGGFSNDYYMYYEDVDICFRLKKINLLSALDTNLIIIHDARRESHKNFKLLYVHIISMLTFFKKYYFNS